MRGSSPLARADPFSWLPLPHGACPLCGLGEGGAEHVWMWCPAVALAWRRYRPAGRPLLDTLRAPLTDASSLASLLHQTCFFHAPLWGQVWLAPAEGATRLVCMTTRAVARNFSQAAADLTSDSDAESDASGPAGPSLAAARRSPQSHSQSSEVAIYDTWSRAPWGCPTCDPRLLRAKLHASSLPARHGRSAAGSGAMRLCPVTSTRVAAEGRLLTCRSTASEAGWLLPGPRWVPVPRTVDAPHSALAPQHLLVLWRVARLAPRLRRSRGLCGGDRRYPAPGR